MEADVRDALIAWQGGELPPDRAEALLARLRSDAEFRRAFAEEAWTLSLARVAQGPAPRWLALHEELGLTSATQAATDDRREKALLTAIRRESVRFVNIGWRRAAYGLMAAAAALALFVAFLSSRQRRAEVKPQMLALVVQSQNAVWKNREPARLAAGGCNSFRDAQA